MMLKVFIIFKLDRYRYYTCYSIWYPFAICFRLTHYKEHLKGVEVFEHVGAGGLLTRHFK